MTINEIITITISIFSLLISIATFIVTKINTSRLEKIYYGQIELSIRDQISSAKNRVASTIQDTNQNSPKNQLVKFSIEELLNSYEEACAKYIDEKIDKKRFKKTYIDEIKNIVESEDFNEYFHFGSKYDAIKKVYNEWFNLEK